MMLRRCVISTWRRRAPEHRGLRRRPQTRGPCAASSYRRTHKMAVFARMQVERGAQGITCATVSEAETMAAGGHFGGHFYRISAWSISYPARAGAWCLKLTA